MFAQGIPDYWLHDIGDDPCTHYTAELKYFERLLVIHDSSSGLLPYPDSYA